MTGLALNNRLLHPTRRTDFFGLLVDWQQDVIELQLAGMAAFCSAPAVLNKVRGALGNILLESGSQSVRDRRPCDWSPPCAAEVFFAKKPQIQIGPYFSEITKPYVLSLGQKGQDLVVRMRVFGFARKWTREVVPALVQALNSRVQWRQLAGKSKTFVPSNIEVSAPRTVLAHPIELPAKTNSVRLEFQTPLDAERGTFHSKPHLIFERLTGRAIMLARWHEIEIDVPWKHLQQIWLACDYQPDTQSLTSFTKYGGHNPKNRIVDNQAIYIEGDMEQLLPLLAIGENANVGRGASIGLGRYRLSAGNKSA